MESTSTKVTLKELIEAQGNIEICKMCRYLYLVFTDKIMLEKNTESILEMDTADLLECRIFDEGYELRGKRTSIAGKWYWREKDEQGILLSEEQYFDSSYFLDIDATSVNGNKYLTTTGNKEYTLPVDIITEEIYVSESRKSRIAKNKLKIRNYISYYPETGQAYIEDWRLLGFEGGEDNA